MAIVDFLCLNAGNIAGRNRLALVNDHKYGSQSWGKWGDKVKGVNEFLRRLFFRKLE